MNFNRKILLASGSPRRKELLESAGFQVRVEYVSIDETPPADVEPKDLALYLAKLKGQAALHLLQPDEILVSADTTVLHDKVVLNKPADKSEAALFLQKLSGEKHKVRTGVYMSDANGKYINFDVTSKVTLSVLTAREIEHYIDQYQPFDKAGAYGIQEWIGLCCIEKISGSYTNIVGLPVQAVYEQLRTFFVD